MKVCMAQRINFAGFASGAPAHVDRVLLRNTSESTVQKWETGSKQPSGMALKLLAVVQKHGLGVLA